MRKLTEISNEILNYINSLEEYPFLQYVLQNKDVSLEVNDETYNTKEYTIRGLSGYDKSTYSVSAEDFKNGASRINIPDSIEGPFSFEYLIEKPERPQNRITFSFPEKYKDYTVIINNGIEGTLKCKKLSEHTSSGEVTYSPDSLELPRTGGEFKASIYVSNGVITVEYQEV